MLQGRFTRLRTLETEDGEFVRQLRNSSRVRSQFMDRRLISGQRQRRFVESLATSDREAFLIAEEIHSGKAFGVYFLSDIQHRHQRAEAGVFTDDGAEISGLLVLEGLYLLYDYAFNTLNLRKLVGHVLATNHRGLQLNERVGMVREGVLKDHVFGDGAFHDVIALGLFREHFNNCPCEAMAYMKGQLDADRQSVPEMVR